MKKFFISTSIVYTNGAPHVGFAFESVQADVIARFKRLKGDKVFFLTGTDEHGSKIFQTAQQNNKEPYEFVTEIADQYKKDLRASLNLSWDDFIRTTDKEKHWPGVIKMWQEIEKSGDIYEKAYQGLYCVGCEAFKTEKDLVDGKCPEHQKEPELIEEKNYFFKLSKYQEQIQKAIESDKLKIIPQSRKNEVLSFIKEGLNDVSISRPTEKLTWGIPVPGHDDHVMYVWIDALTNYISALGYGRDEENFKSWWNDDSKTVHMIGKDILRFHSIIWIGMLLSAKLSLPKEIVIHGYITNSGQKMSKSLGNVVSPLELVEKFGTDAVRYYLLREIPAQEDGDYSEEKFRERYNGELANGLGNFSARVLTLSSRFEQLEVSSEYENFISELSKDNEKKINEKMEEYKFHEAISAIWDLISTGDKYVNDTKPWENSEAKKDEITRMVLLLEKIAKLLNPFLPQTSEKILNAIRREENILKTSKTENLFPRL